MIVVSFGELVVVVDGVVVVAVVVAVVDVHQVVREEHIAKVDGKLFAPVNEEDYFSFNTFRLWLSW